VGTDFHEQLLFADVDLGGAGNNVRYYLGVSQALVEFSSGEQQMVVRFSEVLPLESLGMNNSAGARTSLATKTRADETKVSLDLLWLSRKFPDLE